MLRIPFLKSQRMLLAVRRFDPPTTVSTVWGFLVRIPPPTFFAVWEDVFKPRKSGGTPDILISHHEHIAKCIRS
jgi:hypothetical protein